MWDVFILQTTEDKDSFVRPLAFALRAYGLSVWYQSKNVIESLITW